MGDNHKHKKIRNILINEIEKAKETIHIVMSFFIDMELADAIKKKARTGVRVEIILNDEEMNSYAITSLDIPNVKIYYYGVGKNYPDLHQKFCIIDKKILLTGYHGWAYAAHKNEHEDIEVENYQKDLIENYLEKFNGFKRMCGSSRMIHIRSLPNLLFVS